MRNTMLKIASVAVVAVIVACICWWIWLTTMEINHKVTCMVTTFAAGVGLLTFMFTQVLSSSPGKSKNNPDLPSMQLYRMAFDRSAFRTKFASEVSSVDYQGAIKDTVMAIDTGVLKDRETKLVIHQVPLGGKGSLSKLFGEMQAVTDALDELSNLYEYGRSNGKFEAWEVGGKHYRRILDPNFPGEMDGSKIVAISKMNHALTKAGLPLLPTELKDFEKI